MPIYEYACEACTHKFETLQKFDDAALTTCPVCEQESLRKLLSAAAFRLKGSGWYETDFKSGDKKNIAGAESERKSSSSETKTSAKENGVAAAGAKTKTESKSSSNSGGKSNTSISAGSKKTGGSSS